MVFARSSALLLLSLSLLWFTVVDGEVTEAVPPIPPHHHAHPHNYPAAAPTPAPHHQHHHAHPHNYPAAAPTPAPHHHHHHHQAPAHPPAPSPKYTPKAPSPARKTNRSLVAVQGVVYCKRDCKYADRDSLYGSSALPNASVQLRCNNTKITQEFLATTDRNGYFLLKAPATITSFGAHKCVVYQWFSNDVNCPNPTPLNDGSAGARLRPNSTFVADKHTYVLYSVGPFVFDPQCTA